MPMPQGPPNPMARISDPVSREFNGDDVDRPHEILWNKDAYIASKGGIPANPERIPYVVIGGGVAGLSSAYFMRDLRPVLLEQAPQFGGNSRGEQIGGTAYSIGAAYLVKPTRGSDVETLLKDLGLLNHAKVETSETATVFMNGKFQRPFWSGATDPQAGAEFKRVFTAFKYILDKQYPNIPYTRGSGLSPEMFKVWDQMNFSTWMKQALGPVHPHVEEYLQLYAWSSFCASLNEISAAQMLNFITSETDSILALPGGNGSITEAMYVKLQRELPPNSLRPGCFVIDITPNAEGVRILYEDGRRVLRSIQAKSCVFASPKFVASKVITGLPALQYKAISNITYRAYIVANVLLNRKIQSPTYELYDLKGQVPEAPRAMNPSDRPFTDICFGSWAAEPNTDRGVITVYKALPYDGARQFLFSPMAHEKNKRQIESQVPQVLHAMGLSERDVAGIRMTRWGHSLPVASVGALTNGLAATASQSLGKRIVFANQDNFLNPSFESAFASAKIAAQQVRG
jgi:protoporphyrinogen oxidase